MPGQEVLVLHIGDAFQAHDHSRVPELSVDMHRHLNVQDLHGLAGGEWAVAIISRRQNTNFALSHFRLISFLRGFSKYDGR